MSRPRTTATMRSSSYPPRVRNRSRVRMYPRPNSAEGPARQLRKQSSVRAGTQYVTRSPSPRSGLESIVSGGVVRRRSSAQYGGVPGAAEVRRWDGPERATTEWDGLRRDPELWQSEGDCLIHLYGQGLSRRGPAFRVPFSVIADSGCGPLFDKYSTHIPPEVERRDSSSSSENGGFFTNPSGEGKHNLYIPAPAHCSREESFRYHLTTRNFFAWMLRKPVVGKHLGPALVDLLVRMEKFRSADVDNLEDLQDYVDEQEYADFRECPDYALAGVYFAEHFQLRDMWTDAFVHCTGMNDRLLYSPEFEPVSRVSKALITRAKLEMDIRIENCGHQLKNFLDAELSQNYLGLGAGARSHLERFRSFLHGHYVGKFGYWPPGPQSEGLSGLSKDVYRSMYFEFRNLYEYLVDDDSTTSTRHSSRPAEGGICVLQNITMFDKRNRHVSLPHPQPLIPAEGSSTPPKSGGRMSSFVEGRRFSLAFSKNSKTEKRIQTVHALFAATNKDRCNPSILRCELVRKYAAFEKECTLYEEDKVSAADARKVRWILVYGILQTLISVTRAPPEVRDVDNVSYHLCCLTGGTPPWETSRAQRESGRRNSSIFPPLSADSSPTSNKRMSFATSSHRKSDNIPVLPLPLIPSTPSPIIQPDHDVLFANWTTNGDKMPITSSSPRSSQSSADEAFLSSLPPSGPPAVPPRRSIVSQNLSVLHPQPLRPDYHHIIAHGYDDPAPGAAAAAAKKAPKHPTTPTHRRGRTLASTSAFDLSLSSPPRLSISSSNSSSPKPFKSTAGGARKGAPAAAKHERKQSRWSGSTGSSDYAASLSSTSSDASFGHTGHPASPPEGGVVVPHHDVHPALRSSAGSDIRSDLQYKWAWNGSAADADAEAGVATVESSVKGSSGEVVVVRQRSVEGFGGSSLGSQGVWS